MDLKPYAPLTRSLRLLLKIVIAVTVFAVFAGVYQYHSYAVLPADVEVDSVLLPSDTVSAVVGLVQFVLAILTGITFLRWTYRSNKNLRALSGQPMAFTPGWAVGWYFIPVANLFKPYQAMKEIWRVSHETEAAGHALVGWWWALWLMSNFLGQMAFKAVMRADDTASMAVSALLYMVSDGLDVVLNIVALILVSRIGEAYARNMIEPAPGAEATPPAAAS